MATLVSRPPKADLDALTPGTMVGGKYKIVKQIGRGGFGSVFRCQHIGTGQDVAVKVLALPGGENDVVFQRFFLEARSTAGLGHPNTLRVFDFGQDASGACFLVMELLDGRTLADELRERLKRNEVFTEMEALAIGDAVLRSLTEAHEKGLIHRDIKPHNIFLHEVHGDDPTVKVLDFGIAHSAELAAQTALTEAGQILGTPSYMSPEQAQGLPVDRRSDLYSVGIVLYELVTGATPFVGDTPVSTLYQHVHQLPPPLRDRARVVLSDDFVRVVERAIAKRPQDRYPDAPSMRQALMGKRGHVSGSQLVVRVSSSTIPAVVVNEPRTGQQLPQITVNGETMDAASLQPNPTRRSGLFKSPEQPTQRKGAPPPHRSNRLMLVGTVALMLVIAVTLVLIYLRHVRDLADGRATVEMTAPKVTPKLPQTPPPPVVSPPVTPEVAPEHVIPDPVIPPPVYGTHPLKGKLKGKKCDPFDPYCK
jgi:serine/threonine protein kinase